MENLRIVAIIQQKHKPIWLIKSVKDFNSVFVIDAVPANRSNFWQKCSELLTDLNVLILMGTEGHIFSLCKMS